MCADLMKDLEIIEQRLKAKDKKNFGFPECPAKTAVELKGLLIPGCAEGALRLPWVDYTKHPGSSWPLANAAGLAKHIAAWSSDKDGEERAASLEIIKGIFIDFINGKYVNPNWWWNEIGIPENLAKALIFVYNDMPKDVVNGVLQIIENGSVLKREEIIKVKSAYHTGGNLASYCIISLHHACVIKSYEEIRLVVDALSEETTGAYEGLQPDGSFFQHGRRLYSFAYGSLYLSSFAEMSAIFAGTSYEFPLYAKENVLKHLLDGVRHMIGGFYCDISASGRHYTRPNAGKTDEIIGAVRNLLENKELPRRGEVEDMLLCLEKGVTPYRGMKYFPCSRLLTLQTGNLYLSFKGIDPSISGAEICTEENGMAVNFSYGRVTSFMRTGAECYNVSPLLDFSYIPGTTTREETDEEILAYPDFTWYKVNTDTYGGAEIGDIGVCFVGGENYGVTSTVAAFALPFGMVLLGTDLSEANGKEIHTTVNQCNLLSEVRVEADGREIIHGGVLYRNLDEKTRFEYKCEHKEYPYRRNWRPNNTPVSGDIFTLYIPKAPENNSYAYMVCEEELREQTVEIVRNDSECQAIKIPGGRIAAVFHKTGAHKLGDREIFAVKNEIKVI